MVSPPLINTLTVNSELTDKLITTFREYPASSNNFLVDSVQKYGQGGTLNNYLYNSAYDSKLNVTGMVSLQQPPLSMIWDYQSMYPVAKVANAAPGNIAYTSFETTNTGNWTISGGAVNTLNAITGSKGYSLSSGNSITKSSITSGNYIVSYWSMNGSLLVNAGIGTSLLTKNGWTLYEHRLNNASAVSIAGTAVIDELRLYPALAQITTYTYDPLIGLTSQNDNRNNIVYYEYDGFNRLRRIRDADNHIVKMVDYQYQVPVQTTLP
ncbi:hypothetical protein [Paraflavitalea speifideaquila]|uniref:hypothetical protein n=1 Tax=Paraflavitalea speifideaquila TaxID=3076558 RepID=UPI0028ECD6A9|nr:hypothetical protein [Paraflavitalea speifideiaquila]